ncbi:hypothetical protein D3C80_1871400 [compost metagenome]
MPGLFAGKTAGAVFGGGEGEGGRQVDRRDQRPLVIQRVVAVVNRTGRKAKLIVFIVHGQRSLISYNAMLKLNAKNSKITDE